MGQRKKILAVASGGGHWQQLMQLTDAFEGHQVRFATTLKGLPEEFGVSDFVFLTDCNRHSVLSMAKSLTSVIFQLVKYRPDVVVSTGALPGVMALSVGRILGARTLWIDSIANAEQMSLSGKLAKHVAHECLCQWRHVAEANDTAYAGAIL
ncbi:UDP-N-acetylglucosamine--LPS N-acetylglucosamine transferase [Pseudophaeobacter profundi]|jgi:UDP-N-acetylglucosamine:LPS N-acetylglucosamine transferase|uniref:UDP-N-acetylglucosamine--LPS N-acetylglucosamine transferase n=1 Tax=Pseudophaeobacter profundi TaxID=3034152 RepID=UPI0024325B0B|nr:UDP-N-acetylglucosamine--LPS N-acetylglucosamine transferase [Pseudophaeobacter profundi]